MRTPEFTAGAGPERLSSARSLVAHRMRDVLLDAARLAGIVAILRDDLAHLPAAADDGLAELLLVLDARVAVEGEGEGSGSG